MNYIAKCSLCDAKMRVGFGLTLPPSVQLPQGWAILIVQKTPRGPAELVYLCPLHAVRVARVEG
jgi:hypothetical protein